MEFKLTLSEKASVCSFSLNFPGTVLSWCISLCSSKCRFTSEL